MQGSEGTINGTRCEVERGPCGQRLLNVPALLMLLASSSGGAASGVQRIDRHR